MPKQKRYGRQEPTFEVIGDYDYTYGSAISEFFSDYGIKLTPYQQHELDIYAARIIDDDGEEQPAGRTIALTRCRQTGKSFALRLYALFEAAIFGKIVLWTAHRHRISKTSFKFLKSLITDNENLNAMLKPKGGLYESNQDLGFYFKSGGQILFSSRSNSGARGDSADLIVYDEIQELTSEQLTAIAPLAIASTRGGQSICIGTPPDALCVGDVFKRWHDDVHENPKDPTIWWIEWAIDYIPDDIMNPDIWYDYNPGLGYRITERALKDDAAKMPPEKFAAEHLGYWHKGLSYKAVISTSLWNAIKIDKDEANTIQGHVAYGIKFSPDGLNASLSVCVKPTDDKPFYVELLHRYDLSSAGVSSIADFFAENDRLEKSLGVIIDGNSNADNLLEALYKRGVKNKHLFTVTTPKVYANACAHFFDQVKEKTVAHIGQPELAESVTQCKKRKVTGSWGFDPINEDVDSTITDSAALAVYLANTSKRNP